ncbi:hypothetical protein [Aquaspirillum soli]
MQQYEVKIQKHCPIANRVRYITKTIFAETSADASKQALAMPETSGDVSITVQPTKRKIHAYK